MSNQNELIKLSRVIEMVHYTKPSIYRLMADGLFPKPIKMGPRAVAWLRSDIESFIEEKIKESKTKS